MKKLIILYSFILMSSLVKAQSGGEPAISNVPANSPPKASFADRLFFGGDIGLNFGDVTYVAIAPTIGYKVTEKLGIGVGPSYSYLRDKRFANYEYETSTYGGRVFGQYRVLEQAIAYAEYGIVNAEVYDLLQTNLVRRNIPSLLVGGGYIAPIGGNSNFTIIALWNLAESDYNYYQNPIIRAGFNVGF